MQNTNTQIFIFTICVQIINLTNINIMLSRKKLDLAYKIAPQCS